MTFTLSRWCAVSCLAALLAACGGGGDDTPAAGPADAHGPTTVCTPTLEHFDALRINTSEAQVVDTMGCDGRRIYESSSGGVMRHALDWGRQGGGPYLMANFENGVLYDVTATDLTGVGTAACLPTRVAVSQLRDGMTMDEVFRIVGCPGQMLSVNRSVAGAGALISWGLDDQGPFLTAYFLGGRLAETTAMRL
jgi:hypothetical protein